jgi:hypothetical protein
MCTFEVQWRRYSSIKSPIPHERVHLAVAVDVVDCKCRIRQLATENAQAPTRNLESLVFELYMPSTWVMHSSKLTTGDSS